MKKRNVFWGFIFILAAVLIILNKFGFFVGISMFDIVATAVLGGIMILSLLHLNFWGILFPAAGICIIFAEQWNITDFTPWPALLTALLCSIGLSMIFNRSGVWIWHINHHDHHGRHDDHRHTFGSSVINEQDDNVIHCTTSFGESIRYVNSSNFEKAYLKCSFGDMKVYFDNALIPSGTAEIYLDVSFGDTILYIPDNWKIINDTHIFLGDFDTNNRYSDATSPVVTIHGNISFGDAKVIFVNAKKTQTDNE